MRTITLESLLAEGGDGKGGAAVGEKEVEVCACVVRGLAVIGL